MAFDVLVPISYTILFAIGVLALRSWKPVAPFVIAVLTFAVCLTLDVRGRPINNLNFISAGIIGLWFGTRDLSDIDRLAKSCAMLAILGLVYLGVTLSGSLSYPAQIYTTVVALIVLYAIGRGIEHTRWSAVQVCLLGRYSLLSYIVQILLLQLVGALSPLATLAPVVRAIVLVVIVAYAMRAVVALMDMARKRVPLADRLYRSIFA